MYIVFDTETTGLPNNFNAPLTDSANWPRLVQLAWQVHDKKGALLEVKNYIIRPDGFEIPYAVTKIHGISNQQAVNQGFELSKVLDAFNESLKKVSYVVGHNITFDNNIVGAELFRTGQDRRLLDLPHIDTMKETVDFCALPGGRANQKFKFPNLTELHTKLFGEAFDAAHNAAADVEATARCFLEIVRLGIVPLRSLGLSQEEYRVFLEKNPKPIKPIGLNILPFNPNEVLPTSSRQIDSTISSGDEAVAKKIIVEKKPFVHLHVHTQYSILDGAAEIGKLINKAKEDNMPAIAITDHGNMFGAKLFHKTALKAGLKPILGCEVYVARRTRFDQETKQDGSGYHLVLLAKNQIGYNNLIEMVSLSWLEGFYYKPRIDKDLLKEKSEGIIALSACLGGEIPKLIMESGVEAAEKSLLWYKEVFGDDFYLEMQRHRSGIPEKDKDVYEDQVFVNQELITLGQKHGVKLVVSNDVHFIDAKDAEAHDRLICLSTGKDLDDPARMKYTTQEWFKTTDEMYELFHDQAEALLTTQEIADKVEVYELDRKPIMPEFDIPEDFGTFESFKEKFKEEDLLTEFGEQAFNRLGRYESVVRVKLEAEYLRKIVYEGVEMRWGEITEDIRERVDFELNTIKTMGFPGYFLIVWDFLKAARSMGVSVGPGRGSAAGSVVAYCLRITEIDPIKYKLLFERFLNPDRISMPDIDIDFDDEGRGKVLDWVVKKYGEKRVAHIITFGKMAAKLAIRDVARVQRLPLSEANRLAKMVPEKPGMSLRKAFKESPELLKEKESGSKEVVSVLDYAVTLEGSVRNTGTHACGIIIGKDDLEHYVPVSTAKDSELKYVTQYDGKHVEDIGLLKMDFLGLKTLSIIKDAVENVRLSTGNVIDIENVPLEDPVTYELYSKGETTALFQFESDGMKKHLRALKPTRFEDLIAMNALYRPGPMEYIPSFVKRKHGQEKIEYDLPEMEEYLEETYGITVYQEQVMLLSRKLAGFTRGQSDSLRKAMGKKIKSMMDELKIKFVEGCRKNNHPDNKIEKIWKDWEAFAEYAFNKSHATCYSYVSYQTGYLKAHYPAQFMASVLSHNLNNLEKITFFIEECKRMVIMVLGPDVNESRFNFFVNTKGEIRFGMAAIKGVGEGPVSEIIREREENGRFKNIVDFISRVNLRTVNKKSIEALAMAGAFEGFSDEHRAQYFYKEKENGPIFLEKIIKHVHAALERKNAAQVSLFDDPDTGSEEIAVSLPICDHWSDFEQLKHEKEVTGFYLTGHPLDTYSIETKTFATHSIRELKIEPEKLKGREIKFTAIVTASNEKMTKKGNPFGSITLEDTDESITVMMFSEQWLKMRHFFDVGSLLFVTAKMEQRYNSEETEIRIQAVSLLSTLLEERVRSICLSIDQLSIDQALVNELKALEKEYPGKTAVSFKLLDHEEKISVELSSEMRVDPSGFLKEVKSRSLVDDYKLKVV